MPVVLIRSRSFSGPKSGGIVPTTVAVFPVTVITVFTVPVMSRVGAPFAGCATLSGLPQPPPGILDAARTILAITI